MVVRHEPLPREEKVDLLVGEGIGGLRRGTDGCRSATHHHDRRGLDDPAVRVADLGVDLCDVLHRRSPPEPVGHARRDDQYVEGLGLRRPVLQADGHGTGVGVQPRQGALHDAHPVEPTQLVEGQPVVAGPALGAGQPATELLSAQQSGLHRDAHDVRVLGQPHGDQAPGVAQASDDDSGTAHAAALVRRGGRGTNFEVRATTSAYSGRRSSDRSSIIGMLAP